MVAIYHYYYYHEGYGSDLKGMRLGMDGGGEGTRRVRSRWGMGQEGGVSRISFEGVLPIAGNKNLPLFVG